MRASPIPPIAKNSSTAAMVTKMSLKLLTRRKVSSSVIGIVRAPATCARKASAASPLIAPAATASRRSFSLYMNGSPRLFYGGRLR